MSRRTMIVAGQYAVNLPGFDSLSEAEGSLFAYRDAAFVELLSVSEFQCALDYTPESLKLLEQWFFASGEPVALASGYSSAHAIGFYLGEIYRRHAGFKWVVQEFVFSPGHYEIGVSRGLISVMLTKGRLPKAAGNKQRQSLWREFRKYAGGAQG